MIRQMRTRTTEHVVLIYSNRQTLLVNCWSCCEVSAEVLSGRQELSLSKRVCVSIAIITLFSFCIGRCIVDCICVPLSFKYRRLVVANVLHCYVFVVLFVVSCLWLVWMLLMGCIKFWLFFVAPPIVLLLVLIAARGRKGKTTRKRERERRWDG